MATTLIKKVPLASNPIIGIADTISNYSELKQFKRYERALRANNRQASVSNRIFLNENRALRMGMVDLALDNSSVQNYLLKHPRLMGMLDVEIQVGETKVPKEHPNTANYPIYLKD